MSNENETISNPKNSFIQSIYQTSHSLQTIPFSSLNSETPLLVYFTAYWSVPCRVFTQLLDKFYKETNKDKEIKQIEVIFVSFDNNQTTYEDYYKTMDWMALPYDAKEEKKNLMDKYIITGIPSLCLIAHDGELIHNKCREDLNKHKTNL